MEAIVIAKRFDLLDYRCSHVSRPASNNSSLCQYVARGKNQGNMCAKDNCKKHFTCPGGVKWTFRTIPNFHFVASVTNHTCGEFAKGSAKTTQYTKHILSTFIRREMENGTTFDGKNILAT